MLKVVQLLEKIGLKRPPSTRAARVLLDRDPGLRQVRQEQRDVERRVLRLETQAKVRARRQ